jgi:hypothetical protein
MPEKLQIITELDKVLAKFEKENQGDALYQYLKDVNDQYNKLLENGIVKKRGYTLRGIEDFHLFNVRFNS